MSDDTLFVFVIFGGISLFAIAMVVYDLLAERQHRRERERGHRSA